ncbi:hypothetical protein Hdeb2414_s0019g00546581 [Helianthus debilis subsp. tardiflorus]
MVLWQIDSSWCKLPPIFTFTFKDLMATHELPEASKEKARVLNWHYCDCRVEYMEGHKRLDPFQVKGPRLKT